jgi:hypothetical protein
VAKHQRRAQHGEVVQAACVTERPLACRTRREQEGDVTRLGNPHDSREGGLVVGNLSGALNLITACADSQCPPEARQRRGWAELLIEGYAELPENRNELCDATVAGRQAGRLLQASGRSCWAAVVKVK